MKTIHAYVSGRVQGVFFRQSTRDKALALQLTGWVKNLPDGRVELIASGSPEHIELFASWLQKGPPLARVEQLIMEDIAMMNYLDFIIER